MKKSIIAIAVAAVVAVGAVGGYAVYQKQAEEKAFEEKVSNAISSLSTIVVNEKQDLPPVEQVFAGTENVINIDTVQPDISDVTITTPGEYDVKYTFKDVNGGERQAVVKCNVKPELKAHVSGMRDIEIEEGEEVPTESGCQFDEYVSAVTLVADDVRNDEAGVYDISYDIIGANGDMESVDGYTCTVNAAPTPTPTPSPSPTPTPKPTKAPDKKEEPEEEQPVDEDAVGNVEVQEEVVETGDENNIIAIGALIIVCLGAAAGAVVYKKKKRDSE